MRYYVVIFTDQVNPQQFRRTYLLTNEAPGQVATYIANRYNWAGECYWCEVSKNEAMN